MGQFPVPAFRVKTLLFVTAVIASLSVLSLGVEGYAKADDDVTQQSTGPKVDLDILNANLLSVVRALRLQSGAEIVVEGGDKAYNAVSLTVSGSLSTVLGYVADSAGAVVTRNSDGVYILRPASEGAVATSISTGAPPAAAPAVSDSQESAAGPMHWERLRLQYINPKYAMMMLNDKEGDRPVNPNVDYDEAQVEKQNTPNVYLPQAPFTQTTDIPSGPQVQPGVPNGQGMVGGSGATMANQFMTNPGSQAQQFAPQFDQNGGGGFGNVGGGNAGAAGAGTTATRSLRPEGIQSIIADDQDNSLLVQGDAQGITELREVISLLDVPAKQIQVKAEFITASVSKVDQFGINFELVPAPNISTSFTGSTVQGSTVVEFSQGNLVAEMQAQLSQDTSKVVSAPLITTTNNTPATITFNEQIPYIQGTTSVNGSGTATTATGTAFLNVTSGLTVTPQINGDNSVTMDLNLPNTTTNPNAGGLPPTVTNQTVHTLRTVANGETMVIGGLVSKNDSNARVSVPFLGSLPIIGSLFRTRNINDANTELLIFITPTILPYPGQAEAPPPAIDSSGAGVTP